MRKPLVEFGLRETTRLLTGLKWGLGGSQDFFGEELRARKRAKSLTEGILGQISGSQVRESIYTYLAISGSQKGYVRLHIGLKFLRKSYKFLRIS